MAARNCALPWSMFLIEAFTQEALMSALHDDQVYSETVAPTTNASTWLILPRQKGSFILCPALMIVTSHIWT